MTTLGNGTTVCDSCDYVLGNGSLFNALIVSDHRDGIAINLHFCRDREDENGGTIVGCAAQVLRPQVLSAYGERNPYKPLFAAPVVPTPSPDPADPPPDPAPVVDPPDPTPNPTPNPNAPNPTPPLAPAGKPARKRPTPRKATARKRAKSG